MAEQRIPTSRMKRWLIIAAWVTGTALTLLAGLAGVAVIMLSGQSGRDATEQLIDGRNVSRYGTLQATGLTGNVLDDLRIERLTLEDGDGIWLEMRQVRMDWSLWPILGRHIDIETLSAETVIVHRRPVLGPARPTGQAPRLSLSIQDLAIRQVELSEAVTGGPASLRVDGQLNRRGRDWIFDLNLRRTDQPGDDLFISGQIGSRLELDARLDASAQGPISALLGIAGHDLSISTLMAGPRSGGSGQFTATLDSRPLASGQIEWDETRTVVDSHLDPMIWPGLEIIKDVLGGSTDLSVTIPLQPGPSIRFILDQASATIEAPRLSALVDRSSSDVFEITVHEAASALTTISREQVGLGHLEFSGTFDRTDGFVITGDLIAEDVSLSFGSARSVQGPIEIRGPLSSPTIQTSLNPEGVRFDNPQIQTFAGGNPRIETGLSYQRDTRILDIAAFMIEGSGVTLQGTGRYRIEPQSFDGDITFSRLQMRDLQPELSGLMTGRTQLDGTLDGPVTFSFEASASDLSGPVQQALGEEARASGQGRWNRGRNIQLSELRVDSPQTHAQLAGGLTERGWTGSGQVIWTGTLPVASVSMTGEARLDFDASANNGALFARTQLQTGRLQAGPVTLENPLLRTEIGGALDDLSGEWRLTANEDIDTVDLTGQLSRSDDRIAFEEIIGEAFGFNLDGFVRSTPEADTFRLAAAPQSGFGRVIITGSERADRIEIRADGEDLVGGDLSYLDEFSLTVEGAPENLALNGHAFGAYGARFELNLEGQARVSDGLALSLSPSGRYGQTRFQTLEPVLLRQSEAGTMLSARLGVDEGYIDVRYGPDDNAIPVLDARLEMIPAALLSYRRNRAPATGQLNSTSQIRFAPDGWLGDITIQGRDLRPAGGEDDEPVDGEIALALTRTGLRLTASVSSSALNGQADASLATGPVTRFADLTRPDNGISGTVELQGLVTPLTAFHIAENRRISGQILGSARIAGTLGTPSLSGDIDLSEGGYRDDALGMHLSDITARARFTDEGLDLTQFEGRDQNGGRFNGTGRLNLQATQLSGQANLTFESLRVAQREELTATGSGTLDLSLEGRQLDISGSASIERAEIRPPEARAQAITEIAVSEINIPGDLRRERRAETTQRLEINLDYELEAPARIFVRGPQFDTEWSLDMRASGSPDDITLRGNATLIRGRADLLGRPFQFQDGRISFAGAPMESRLNITATRQARDIEARLRVTGTAQSPRIQLTSNPALPEDEIAARILFDQGAANLTGLQAAQMAAALSSFAGGVDPFSAVRTATGLDQLSVGSNADGQTVVSGGRYLTEDVYLELEGTSGGAAPTTRIEWFLGRGLTFGSEITGTGDGAISLSWRTQYD